MKKDSEKKAGKTSFDPKDLVDKPIPNVYGPSPEKMRQRRREIEERNRQRRMQREREAQDCDARIEIVYGPMPPTTSVNDTRNAKIDELVDMPTEDLYGPMPPGVDDPYMQMYGPMPPGVDDPYMLMYGPMPPSDEITVTIPKEEGKDEDKKGEEEEVAEEKRGFFARLFGKKRS